MGIDALCALPVETLAAKDCLMFLWATFPMLPEALRLIQAWGFTFKTVAFVSVIGELGKQIRSVLVKKLSATKQD